MLLLDSYKRMPEAAKAALWFTICNFFIAGLGFITGPLFTRLLPPEEYGVLTQFMTYEQIILIVATWEIQIGAYQRGLFKYDKEWDRYTQSTLLLINLLTTLFFCIVFIFVRPISAFTRFPARTISLLYIYLLTNPAYICWLTRNRTLYKYKKVVVLTVMYSLLNIIIPLVAVLSIEKTAVVKFNATLITSSVLFSIFYFRSICPKNNNNEWKVIKAQWQYMLVYQAPLVFHSLSYLVLGQADRIMIGKMVGDREAAFYGVAYTLASAVTILQNSLNQALTPWRYSKLKEKSYSIVGATTNVVLVIIGGAILMVVLVAPELMKLLFTEDYCEAVWCIPPVSISVFFMFLYSAFVMVESYYEKTQYIMYVSVFCGLINIGLNYLLIPFWGYIVCGYTTLFSYILFAFLHYWCMMIVCKKAIPDTHIYSVKTIILISLGVTVSSVLITMLYPYCLARYILLFILILFAFYHREKIMSLLSMIRSRK